MSMSSIITTNKNSTITAPTYTSTSVIARNSASNVIQIQAAEKNDRTRNKAALTGFRTVITKVLEPISTAART